MVYCDHDVVLSKTAVVKDTLEKAGYESEVVRDAEDELKRVIDVEWSHNKQGDAESGGIGLVDSDGINGAIKTSRFVESTIRAPRMTNLKDLSKLEKMMKKKYTTKQVRAYYPHIPSRTVKIEHNPALVSAPSI
eukprot:9487831-Ditylum_brightwellii.AAC.1